MENLYEESIQKNDLQPAKLFRLMMIILCAISSVLAFLSVFLVFGAEVTLPGLIVMVMFIAIAIVSFVIRNRGFYEMDYTFYAEVNEFEAAKVINSSSRKELVSVNIKSFVIIAPVENSEYGRHSQNVSKTITATVNRDAKHYFAVFEDKYGKKNLLLFEPTEKLLNQFKRKIPSKVLM